VINLPSLDIGIDLGTSTILAGNTSGILLKEPSVVAVNKKNGKVIAIGESVYKMIGRTPEYIDVIRPLSDGVISDYRLTGVLIKHMLKTICKNHLLKPRVIICVPSGITGIESQSVIEAAVEAGARRVHLIEEPVAAALGAGVDITKPNGNLIVDIGGGTTDVAVISLRGIVCKTSVKVAGQAFDEAIIRQIKNAHGLLIGEKTAENVKMQIGSVLSDSENPCTDAKGRDMISGLPCKVPVYRAELVPILKEIAEQILAATQRVLEITPPELVGDIRTNGIIMTGGGSLLHGLDKYITEGTKVETRVAENTVECVAIGTMKSFSLLGNLYDGFLDLPSHAH